MRVIRKLLLVAPAVLAVALAGCQTAGPVAKTGAFAADRPAAAPPGTNRPQVQAAKTNLVMGVGF
jgi:hypothetical protein